ncbi:hypothetical protein FLAT13_02062 [Flavobacterium salmonis]|uniref:Flavodoxin-like domain-containing protein n=1 Tax=Flavobacterium salmonis TaxID=2654844 RepID=A0A6V6YXC9_9FLAO|nr:hypothetical protein FLAT13_02062 [Flavobacterium salmonis]
MKKITIIYFSGSGSTAKFAESIGKGVSSLEGATLNIISIDENDIIRGGYKNDLVINQLETSDAIIFGTPIIWRDAPHSLKPLPMQQLEAGHSKNGKIRSPQDLQYQEHQAETK